jgi:DNA mismatch repair protein MutS2
VLQETTSGALVLLDELAGGTDPREGEALAAGVLDSLCARGGAVAITTHYEGLKALASVDPRLDNASVGFDLATMTPTFRLTMGIPGSSSALAVARRYGMPAAVIERAERFLSTEDRSFETVVKRLDSERAALELARTAAEQREAEARDAATRLEAETSELKTSQQRMLSEEARALVDGLRRAREELRFAQARLRSKKPDPQAVREAERMLDAVGREVRIGGPLDNLIVNVGEGPVQPIRVADLRKGHKVWVQRLRAEAEVVDVRADGVVRVAAGPLKLTVPSNELRACPAPEPAPPRVLPRAVVPDAPNETVPVQTADNTCDLRGLRVEDGVAMAISFLDRAVNEGTNVVFLLHGIGTGALRDAVRAELARSPYVARCSPAGAAGGARAWESRGGDAVTVVWLV